MRTNVRLSFVELGGKCHPLLWGKNHCRVILSNLCVLDFDQPNVLIVIWVGPFWPFQQIVAAFKNWVICRLFALRRILGRDNPHFS